MTSRYPPAAPVDEFTGLSAARFGVYVHFPYCLSKCPYCDFASIAAPVIPQERYTTAVLAELAQRVETHGLRGREVHSIYLGGGTPSLWHASAVAKVLETLASVLHVASGCEITLEANPGAVDAARFEAFRSAGVNRLSMGVQSFEPKTLRVLGRAHDGAEALRAYDTARAAGFTNLSMDFIYGVHGQTLDEVQRDAQRARSLGPEHLSAYALTLDRESLAEEVPLAKQLRRGEVALPPDDDVIAMQRAVSDAYGSAELRRYEISNYAVSGFHSRHNALYWTGGEYLALGSGATGFLRSAQGGSRYANHRSADKYLLAVATGALPEASREPLTTQELFSERLAMGLRLSNGVNVEAVCAAYDAPLEPRRATMQHLLDGGLATRSDGRLALTSRGMDVHSAISARLM